MTLPERPKFEEADLKVIAGMNAAIKDRGRNWVYPVGEDGWQGDEGCVNLLPDGSGACIIGYIAVDQGLYTTRDSQAGIDARRWGVSPPVKAAMETAQELQDGGHTWGEAYDDFFLLLKAHHYDVSELQVA